MALKNILITSSLDGVFHSALEQLLFFNPLQQKVLPEIMHSIEQFGQPYIKIVDNKLRINIDGIQDTQTLFALGHVKNVTTLLGVVIYVRIDEENIAILHIGITEDYSAHGNNSNRLLLIRLIAELRTLAKKIKGVRFLKIMYSKGRINNIKV